ncbi:MAG: methyltransferase [Roseibium sp.]
MSCARKPEPREMPSPVDTIDREITHDAFLDGQVYVQQPRHGQHRAGIDAVFLAAALPEGLQGHVVDLGSGVGTAGFCAAARLASITVTLVEIDPTALALAELGLEDIKNAAFAERVRTLEADITAKGSVRHASGLTPAMADHVIMNPPYYEADRFRASPNSARAGAHMLDERGLEPWVKTATDIVKVGGTLTIVFRADGLQELLSVLNSRFGAIDVIPLHPRPGIPASRVLVRAVRASKAPLQLLPGIVLHGDAGPEFTSQAKSVTRDGKGLGLTERR